MQNQTDKNNVINILIESGVFWLSNKVVGELMKENLSLDYKDILIYMAIVYFNENRKEVILKDMPADLESNLVKNAEFALIASLFDTLIGNNRSDRVIRQNILKGVNGFIGNTMLDYFIPDVSMYKK